MLMAAERPYIHVAREGATVVIVIDNPPVNALHPDVSDEIDAVLTDVELDSDVRSLVLTGSGSCFVAGGDIKHFMTLNPERAAAMAQRVQSMQQRLFACRVPVIAALNGHSLGGGCELMFACDIALADENALIGLPEVRLGLIPGGGGTQMVMEWLSPATARRLLFTGDRLTAHEAQQYGLIDQVVPTGTAREAALEVAARINRAAPLAVAAAKRAANFGRRCSLDRGHRKEIELFAGLFDTQDAREGIAAFCEKREPRFSGH